jgi:hypothetical protein
MQGRLEPAILHFITSPTAWYISSEDSNNHAKFKWRMKPVTETVDDFETKGVKHSIVFRISTGVTDWRGWVGGNQ